MVEARRRDSGPVLRLGTTVLESLLNGRTRLRHQSRSGLPLESEGRPASRPGYSRTPRHARNSAASLHAQLNWRNDRTDCFIDALALGCLHRESPRTELCFSNRMPRTISTSRPTRSSGALNAFAFHRSVTCSQFSERARSIGTTRRFRHSRAGLSRATCDVPSLFCGPTGKRLSSLSRHPRTWTSRTTARTNCSSSGCPADRANPSGER
jgi:hypothetical protein